MGQANCHCQYDMQKVLNSDRNIRKQSKQLRHSTQRGRIIKPWQQLQNQENIPIRNVLPQTEKYALSQYCRFSILNKNDCIEAEISINECKKMGASPIPTNSSSGMIMFPKQFQPFVLQFRYLDNKLQFKDLGVGAGCFLIQQDFDLNLYQAPLQVHFCIAREFFTFNLDLQGNLTCINHTHQSTQRIDKNNSQAEINAAGHLINIRKIKQNIKISAEHGISLELYLQNFTQVDQQDQIKVGGKLCSIGPLYHYMKQANGFSNSIQSKQYLK